MSKNKIRGFGKKANTETPSGPANPIDIIVGALGSLAGIGQEVKVENARSVIIGKKSPLSENIEEIKKTITGKNNSSIKNTDNILKNINDNINKVINGNIKTGILFDLFNINQQQLDALNNSASNKIIVKFINSDSLVKFINALSEAELTDNVKSLMTIFKTLNYATKINADKIYDVFDTFNDILEDGIKPFIKSLSKIDEKLNNISDINKLKQSLKSTTDIIVFTGDAVKDLPSIRQLMFAQIKLSFLITIVKYMNKTIDKISKIEFIEKKGFDALKSIVDSMKEIITELASIDDKEFTKARVILDKFNDIYKSMIKVVLSLSAIIIVGGFLMASIGAGPIIGFASTILIFTGLFMLGISLLVKNLPEDAAEIINAFTESVTKIGIMLVIASLISSNIDIVGLLTFLGISSAFILGISLIYWAASSLITNAVEIGQSFNELVESTGKILILAAAISGIIDWVGLLVFTVGLAVLITSICTVYWIFSKRIKSTIEISENFIKLVAISGLVLVLGGIFSKLIDPIGLLVFTLALSVFIFAIVGTLSLFKKPIKNSFKTAVDFGKLIAIIGVTLLLGSIIMKIVNFIDLLLFAGILLVFIGGIIALLKWAGKRIQKSLQTAKQIGILVMMLGGILLIGGLLFNIFPDLFGNTIKFLILLVLLIGAAVGACILMKKFASKIGMGVLLLGAIVAIFGAAVFIIGILADLTKGVEMGKMWHMFGFIMAVFGGLTLMAGVIGALMVGSAGIGAIILGAGAAFMAALVGIFYTIAEAVKILAEASILFDKTEGLDVDKIINFITESEKIASALTVLSKYGDDVEIARNAAEAISFTISSIGTAVADFASLNIPEYDAETGKRTGKYRSLNPSDFKNAAEGVKEIITTLGGAIVETVEKDTKGIFQIKGALSSLGIGRSKFDMAARSFKILGPLISSIAGGIKDYAELRMPSYDKDGNLEKNKFVKMTKSDFTSAGTNVGEVITTLATAIINTYDKNPQIFNPTGLGAIFGLGTSKFDKVAKSLSKLGKLVSNTASALQQVAEFKIPYYDEQKKEYIKDKFTRFGPEEQKKAAVQVKTIITTLAESILELLEDNDTKDYFEEDGSFSVVMKSLSGLGNTVYGIAKALTILADGSVPEYINGKPTGKRIEINEKAAKTKIKSIVKAFPEAILEVFKENNLLNKDLKGYEIIKLMGNTAEKSGIAVVLQSFSGIGTAITGITNALLLFSSGKIPNKWDKDGNPIGWTNLSLDDMEKAGDSMIKFINKFVDIISNMYNAGNKKRNDIENKLKTVQPPKEKSAWEKFWDGTKKYVPSLFPSFAIGNEISNIIVNNSENSPAKDLYGKGEDSMIHQMTAGLNEFGNIVKSISDATQSLFNNKIPKYNKKGEIIGYEPLSIDNMVDAQENINKFISDTLYTATYLYSVIWDGGVVNGVNHKSKSDLFEGGNGSPITLINKGLNETFTTLNSFASTIDKINESYKVKSKFPEFKKDFNELSYLFNTLSLSNLSLFKLEAESLEKYKNSINGIDTTRVDKLVLLINSMNSLSSKVSSLDKFVTKLTTEFGSIVDKLSNEIINAENLIIDINKKEDARKEKIKEYIEKINKIMNSKLVVEISQASSDQTIEEPTPTQTVSVEDSEDKTTSPISNVATSGSSSIPDQSLTGDSDYTSGIGSGFPAKINDMFINTFINNVHMERDTASGKDRYKFVKQ